MSNKIYFAGSIRGGRDDVELYSQIIEHLKSFGEVLTEHIGDKKILSKGEVMDSILIHDRDLEWLAKSKVIVAEVTQASLGVGYEIGRIVERNVWVPEFEKRKVLCLYRPQVDKRLSAMIAGCQGVVNREYHNLDEAKKMIDGFFTRESLG